ncbi:MAG: hypothetical protein GXY86_00530 [Firmicutes bacterium]|nr:hypothetical protein [Bacillota bacterium]
MRKLYTVIIVAFLLSLSVSIVAFGNSYTLEAENGKLNSPAGIGFDLKTNFTRNQEVSIDSMPVNASLSYGIRPSVTISGEVSRSSEAERQMLVKAYYSPSTSAMGYTAYLGYNLTASEIPMYGVSFWLNSDLLYGFINLESNHETEDSALMVTPGVNLRLGSRLRLSGEVAYQYKEGYQDYGIGASYALVNKFNIKAGITDSFEEDSERIYTTGLAVEL